MGFERLLARRTVRMEANAIREILNVASRPGMISLAGGLPAPESFPAAMMPVLVEAVMARFGPSALQYDRTEGFFPLREALAEYLAGRGVDVSADDLLVATGSQGVLDGIGKVLLSPGDRVVVESPTYLGAISAFNPYEPEYLSLETDEDGLIPESLDEALGRDRIKFVYLVPTFQNPTGRSLSMERRRAVAEILRRRDALLVEDDPYSPLRYRGEALPPIRALAPENVVYVSTLSKVFAPGLRLGFCAAPEPIRRWLALAKQGTDLHTNTFGQALATEYLTGGHLERHLPNILAVYAPRQAAMLDALDRWMPDGFRWTRPDGGMFLWVTGPDGMDMVELYREAVRRKVAYVPGRFFFAEKGAGIETLRLNFTAADPATIDRAVAVLGELFAETTGFGAIAAAG
jgi:2-aminoadipate transaminase